MLQKYITMIRQDIKIAMSNRCGLDELNNLIMMFGFIFILIALFTNMWLFILIGAIFVVLCYVRVFSKNIAKRQYENNLYMKYMGGMVRNVHYLKLCVKTKMKSVMDKEYSYFVCSQCKQVIRVPKGKNKINIKCPKCSHTFIKRT